MRPTRRAGRGRTVMPGGSQPSSDRVLRTGGEDDGVGWRPGVAGRSNGRRTRAGRRAGRRCPGRRSGPGRTRTRHARGRAMSVGSRPAAARTAGGAGVAVRAGGARSV